MEEKEYYTKIKFFSCIGFLAGALIGTIIGKAINK